MYVWGCEESLPGFFTMQLLQWHLNLSQQFFHFQDYSTVLQTGLFFIRQEVPLSEWSMLFQYTTQLWLHVEPWFKEYHIYLTLDTKWYMGQQECEML